MATGDERGEDSSFAPKAELAEMFTALVQTIHSGDPVRFTAMRVVEIAEHWMPAKAQSR